MCRIAIVGPPGSGKFTLARHLGALLDLPVHHLDAHFWTTGWRKVSSERRAAILSELLSGDAWIIEGSYLHCQADLIAAADVVLVLATPRLVCMWRVLKRHWSQAERDDLPDGCRDRLSVGVVWKIATYSDRRIPRQTIKYPQTRKENTMSNEQKAPGVFHRIGGASNIPPKNGTPVSKDEIPEHLRFAATLTDHPIVRDADGTLRYQQNPLIRWLCDEIDLNRMWVEYQRHSPWTQEQFMQFYRDIGYSLGGFEEIWGEALDQMEGRESDEDEE